MKYPKKTLLADYVPMALTAALVLYTAINHQQSFLKTLPTLVTLVVQLLLARANRFAFLLGGTNCLLYGLAQYSEGLYFSMVSSVVISMPIQYASFVLWNRKAHQSGQTPLRCLTTGQRAGAILATLLLWLLCNFTLSGFFSGSLAVLDSLAFSLGVTTSLLAAMQYVDAPYFNLVTNITSLSVWVIVSIADPRNINYLVIFCYNVFMVAKSTVIWTRQYRNQEESNHECQTAAPAPAC